MRTYVAANEVFTINGNAELKISLIIVLATPNTPMPAVTLKQRTIHRK